MKRQILMILAVIFVLAGPLAAQSDDGPTLEETIAWINSKLDDPAHQDDEYPLRFVSNMRITDRSSGRIEIVTRQFEKGDLLYRTTEEFYLGDIGSVEVSHVEVSLHVRDGYEYIEKSREIHSGRNEGRSWEKNEDWARFHVVPTAMGERIADALRHAVEITPPSPNDVSDDLF